jgi:HK97 family phage portal protein
VRWPWSKIQPGNLISISDPAIARLFTLGGGENFSGVVIGEASALALSAVWRSVSLIAGTLASLPLRTLKQSGQDGQHQRAASVFDSPTGKYGEVRWPWQTMFAWKETVLLHLLLHGNAFLFHVLNEAGGIVALIPFHPMCVSLREPTVDEYAKGTGPIGGVWMDVQLRDGQFVSLDQTRMTHITAQSMDGIRGLSPLTVARNSLGTAAAGDRAAAKQFSSGSMISGMVTPEDDLEKGDVDKIKRDIRSEVTGWENAGGIVVVNRRLRFSPWTMTAVDAQFLQSRQFSIEEIARWWGVPPFELMQTDKQTSWGTGIEAQQRGLGRTVLSPWAQRFEQACSPVLGTSRWIEFDFSGLERPDPATEIDLLLKQVGGKPIITVNEARKVRNLSPVDGGDTLDGPAPAAPAPPKGGPDDQPPVAE